MSKSFSSQLPQGAVSQGPSQGIGGAAANYSTPPRIEVGDLVKVIDQHSKWFLYIGEVSHVNYLSSWGSTKVEVRFDSICDQFELSALSLVTRKAALTGQGDLMLPAGNQEQVKPKCECGAAVLLGFEQIGPTHSAWCQMFSKEFK